jgi:ribosomal protein S18 acetylase RimI-like enzyme
MFRDKKGMKIQSATMKDYDSLCRLMTQGNKLHADLIPKIFQEFSGPSWPRERLQHFVESENAEAIVAQSEDGIIGFLTIEKTDYPPYPMFKRHRHAMIHTLVVDESCRRQGVGAMLLEAARDWTRNHGAHFLQTNVWCANKAASAFYVKHGFKTVSQKVELEVDVGEI